MFQSEGVLGTNSDSIEDINAGYMWAAHGFPDPSDAVVRLEVGFRIQEMEGVPRGGVI